ncbi:MAG: alpha/beta hydrolase family protein, partial [Novipirellula sp. JB048]
MNALTNRRGVTPVRSAPVRSAPFRATLAALGTLVYAVTVCAVTGFAHDAVPWTANPQRVEQLSARAGFNYREANVPDYELPDPLTMNDSTQVATAPQWTNQRRGEVLELFRDQVYGRRPQTPYELRFETVAELPDAFAGLATGRSMKAIVTIEDRVFEFPFVLFTPNHTQGKTPAVIAINNRYAIPLEKAVAEADPFWPVKTMLERGYAAATFYTSDVDPDDKHGYAAGIRSFFADGQAPVDDAWRSLSAWGWGASRILDHFANVPSIDVTRVAVVGHSRGGKAALWCAAEDTRFAAAYSNNSGCGGAALSRRAYGETVDRKSV